MASAWEYLDSAVETTSSTTITSASVQPTGGWGSGTRLVVVTGSSLFSPDPDIPGISSTDSVEGDYTTDEDAQYHSTAQRRVTIQSADTAGWSGAQTFTATFDNAQGNRYLWLFAVTEVAATSHTRHTQDDAGTGETAAQSGGLTLSTQPAAGNPRIAVLMTNQQTTNPDGDWTDEETWLNDNDPATSQSVMTSVTETDPDWSWTPTTSKYAICYVEYVHEDPVSDTFVRGRETTIDLDAGTVTVASGPD